MDIKNLTAKDYAAQIEKQGEIAFVPRGNSMWPFIKNKGQTVVIARKSERLNKYDVAFYSNDGVHAVLHRVIEVLPDGYVLCGDSQFAPEKVTEEKVFGVMKCFYQGKKCIDANDQRYLKKVKKWHKNQKIRKFKVKLFFFLKKN